MHYNAMQARTLLRVRLGTSVSCSASREGMYYITSLVVGAAMAGAVNRKK